MVEVYLVSEEAIEGELLAKAMNASYLEYLELRHLSLQKDDAKLFTFVLTRIRSRPSTEIPNRPEEEIRSFDFRIILKRRVFVLS